MKTRRARLQDFLMWLGPTAEDVRRKMVKNGIKKQGCACPMVVVLRKKFKLRGMLAGQGYTESYVGDTVVDSPPHIREFVNNFDDGKYLELK